MARLFGGALSCVLPPGAKDVSEIRQVPDNQEVFVHEETDQSVIIELLEYDGTLRGKQAVRYHFEQLAHSNSAVAHQVLTINQLPNEQLALNACPEAYSLEGDQQGDASNIVHIHLALFRLPQYTTDILVSFNNPTYISQESSSVTAVACNMEQWTAGHWQTLINSLSLTDPSIFITNQS
ncbi:ran guanine nucleotide release factor-like isoform X2 [Corticium candelabrum]|uniref:ran guanine nucleotide release factor-like isoform X2 n=1 Tax=Corticium candelabrum TaxID=121492 RepID=UPI002E267A6D|nr:ran guanine nucleotide release factor-like isoform X2 [Corticium candelabrum]